MNAAIESLIAHPDVRDEVSESLPLAHVYELIEIYMKQTLNNEEAVVGFFNNLAMLAALVGESQKAREALAIATQYVRGNIPEQLRITIESVEAAFPLATA